MKITLIALGSFGDVTPYIALAQGLQQRNHEVTLTTHAVYTDFVKQYGINTFPLSANTKEILASPKGQNLYQTKHLLKFAKDFIALQKPIFDTLLTDCWNACQGADVIFYSAAATNFIPDFAAALKIKAIPAYLQPFHPTAYFPEVLNITSRSFGYLGNRISWYLLEATLWLLYRGLVNAWRAKQPNLAPIKNLISQWSEIRKREDFALYGISPNVVPKPKDWDANIHLTGFWSLSSSKEWQPSIELLNYLADGQPPLIINFGSIQFNHIKAGEMLHTILVALHQTKQRAIFLGDWLEGVGGTLPDTILQLDFCPYEWLLPQAAGVIHYAGLNITASSLLAGKPSITIPFIFDQLFWAQRLVKLGASPTPIPAKRLSAKKLIAAIKAILTNKNFTTQAQKIQEKLKKENGVVTAVNLFEAYMKATGAL